MQGHPACSAYQGPYAGCPHHCRQNAGAEGTQQILAARYFGIRTHQAYPHFKDANQVQGEDKKQQGKRHHKGRILQLKAPADPFTQAAQGKERRRQNNETEHYPQRISQTIGKGLSAGLPRVLEQREHLERKHRQNTGHDIQDHTPKKGEQQPTTETPLQQLAFPAASINLHLRSGSGGR